MQRHLAILFFVCAALPAAAEQSREALFSAMAGHECRIGPREVAEVFGPLGFTPDFVRETLTGLILDGTASKDAQGNLSLPPALCPPDQPVPSPRDALLERFARSDCTLAAGDLDAVRSELGLSEAQLRAIVIPLHDAGALAVTGWSARLAPDLCTSG